MHGGGRTSRCAPMTSKCHWRESLKPSESRIGFDERKHVDVSAENPIKSFSGTLCFPVTAYREIPHGEKCPLHEPAASREDERRPSPDFPLRNDAADAAEFNVPKITVAVNAICSTDGSLTRHQRNFCTVSVAFRARSFRKKVANCRNRGQITSRLVLQT